MGRDRAQCRILWLRGGPSAPDTDAPAGRGPRGQGRLALPNPPAWSEPRPSARIFFDLSTVELVRGCGLVAARAIVTRRAETGRALDHSRDDGAGSERQGQRPLARRERGRVRFGAKAGAAGRSLERGPSEREVQGQKP